MTKTATSILFPESLPAGPFIAGTWGNVDSGGDALDVMNPADGSLVASVQTTTAASIQHALVTADLARTAWRGDAWSRTEVLRHTAAILRSWADDAARILTLEQGKPLSEANWEIHASAEQFDWYADEARRIYGRTVDAKNPGHRILVRHEPVGVVAAFSAWNFPALLSARKIAPALAAGCPIVICPPPEAPLSTLLLAAALTAAGLPAGVLSVLPGDPSAISAALLDSPVVRKISLTGSVPVGRLLLTGAAARVQASAMELGGHAPVLVFEDADIEAAAQACVDAKFRNAGQVCASPSRFFVHSSIADRFTDAFVAATQSLRMGNGLEKTTDVGPLTNQRRVDAAAALVDGAVADGATIACGGHARGPHPRGTYFEPTVLTGVTDTMRIMTEEPFVPVAPITQFDDIDEALQRANATPFGLASYVWSNNIRTVTHVSEGLEAGMVGVNTMLLAAAEAPFGGIKQSGFGREGGSEGILDYLTTKYIRIA